MRNVFVRVHLAARADEGDKPKAEEAPKEEEAAPAEVASALTVADILDIGDGEPLFANFALEDWILLSLRFELFVMARSFAKDAGDPERAGIHESHIGFYYNKYFRSSAEAAPSSREEWRVRATGAVYLTWTWVVRCTGVLIHGQMCTLPCVYLGPFMCQVCPFEHVFRCSCIHSHMCSCLQMHMYVCVAV